MQKGNQILTLNAAAFLAFAFALLNQPLLALLVLGYALLAEKNEWLTRQSVQALALCLCMGIARYLHGQMRYFASRAASLFYRITRGPIHGAFLDASSSLLGLILILAIAALCIWGMVNAVRGKGDIPLLGKLADWTVGIAAKKKPQSAGPHPQGTVPPEANYQPSASSRPPQE